MLKCIRRILVFLLLGAVVNVAVAWGCASGAGHRTWNSTVLQRLEVTVSPAHAEKRFGLLTLYSKNALVVCTAYQSSADLEIAAAHDEEWTREGPSILTRAGWPMASLEGWELDTWLMPLDSPEWKFNRSKNARWGWSWDRAFGGTHTPLIPLRPIPFGFAVNSVLYAMLSWLLVDQTRRLRALNRIRRNLCPACAYPRGSSPVCTECGEALPAARLASRD